MSLGLSSHSTAFRPPGAVLKRLSSVARWSSRGQRPGRGGRLAPGRCCRPALGAALTAGGGTGRLNPGRSPSSRSDTTGSAQVVLCGSGK